MMIPILEALPKTALRLARLQILTSQAQDFSGSLPHSRGMYVLVETETEIRVGITTDEELSTNMTCAMLALDPDDISDGDIDDALGEFINILAGTAKRALESEGGWLGMSTPEPMLGPDSGFAFDLRTSGGLGALIVDPG
jgi:CheY-specific phosphatase CheX